MSTIAVLLTAMGIWQIQRLDWKTQLIAERRERINAPAATLEIALADPVQAQYFPIRLKGVFLHQHPLRIVARTHAGVAGYGIVTPFRVKEGPVLFVDRGWVPFDVDEANLSYPEGAIDLVGYIRIPVSDSWRDSQTRKGDWYRVEPVAMARSLPSMLVITTFYIQAAEVGTDPPYGMVPSPDLHNPHLGYALTWFSLALVVLIMTFIWLRKNVSHNSKNKK